MWQGPAVTVADVTYPCARSPPLKRMSDRYCKSMSIWTSIPQESQSQPLSQPQSPSPLTLLCATRTTLVRDV